MPSTPDAPTALPKVQAPEHLSDLARAPRVALKAKRGAFASGAWGHQDEAGWAPAPGDLEDGLVLWVDAQPWRIMERLAFSVEVQGRALPLALVGVGASPTRAEWVLEAPGLRLRHELSMADGEARTTSAWRARWVLEASEAPVELVVRPHLDMRAPHELPDAARHRVHPHDGQKVTVVHANRWAAMGWDRPAPYQAERRVVSAPAGHQRLSLQALPSLPAPKPLVPGAWRLSLQAGDAPCLWVTAEHGQKKATEALDAYLAEGAAWLAADEAEDAASMAELAPLPAPAAMRAVALVRHLAWPEAADGAPATAGWATLPVQTRAWLEGWWHNRATWAKLGRAEALVAVIDHGLALLDRHQGRFPRWLDGKVRGEAPPSGDVEAMFFTLAGAVLGAEGGGDARRRRLALAAWAFVEACTESRLTHRFGAPVLLESGLLAMLPGASWMDALHDVPLEGRTVLDLPARLPEAWVRQAATRVSDGHYLWEQCQYPNALFPEANAWWIRMLDAALPWAQASLGQGEAQELQDLAQAARASFSATFWNGHQGNLFNLVTTEHKADGTPSASAVVAAALLPDGVLERPQLERVWLAARDRLLVQRPVGARALPLGLLARDAGPRTFHGPAQAHDAVAHAATTPHLYALLRRLGQDATARDLLIANLHAQSQEGVSFLQPEAFGWPEGAEDALPLGAPASWAAQWCDPFLDMAPAVAASWPPV